MKGKNKKGEIMEEFTTDQVMAALKHFQKFGEESDSGYFQGCGWAARALRFHINQLENSYIIDHEKFEKLIKVLDN
jgi:hypothetical protein